MLVYIVVSTFAFAILIFACVRMWHCIDELLDLIGDLSLACGKMDSRLDSFERKLEKTSDELDHLKELVDEIDIDEIKKLKDEEEKWNEGVRNIMSYGLDFPKINKEAVNNGER